MKSKYIHIEISFFIHIHYESIYIQRSIVLSIQIELKTRFQVISCDSYFTQKKKKVFHHFDKMAHKKHYPVILKYARHFFSLLKYRQFFFMTMCDDRACAIIHSHR